MNKLGTRIFSLLVLVALLASTVLPTYAAGQPAKYSSSSNSGERDVVCTTLDGTTAAGYYTGNYTYDKLSAQSSSTLLQSLRTLMTSTHKKQTSYSECRDYATRTDCENGDGRVSLIYTSYSATMSQYNGWNREHVWPKSLGGFETSGAGADLHHIRPSDAVVNSTRGNDKYGNVNGGKAVNGSNPASGYLGGYSGGSYFEPLDNVKGDVARICLYVYVRWGATYSKSNNINNVFQSVDVLLEWCALDPVDTWEMGRNEVVYAIQGNRNVFIDYPEYAWLLFGRSVPADMTTPSGEASDGNAGGGDVGGGDASCTHSSTAVKNKVDATCGKNGYTGDTYCTSCNEIILAGTAVAATGKHSFTDQTLDGTTVRVCTVCGKTESAGSEPDVPCTHENVEVRGAVPQCSEGAYSGDDYCADCGVLLSEGTPLQTLRHEYIDGEIVVPATDSSSGMQEQECVYCGMTNVKTLPALNSAGDGDGTVVVIVSVAGGVALLAVLFFLLKRRLF